jgi:polysaccharide pyruvyl transferase WcaK-like protein
VKILLQGYYGRGNWGDDLLMLIAFRLLRERYATAQIDICTADRTLPYIQRMLGEEVRCLPRGRHGHYDVIVHGGGGVFFDYHAYGWREILREKAIHLIGIPTFLRTSNALRRLLNKPQTSADCRVALGVGVGIYSIGSPRLLSAYHSLSQMRGLWVRDTKSTANMQRFGRIFKGELVQGSDMVFLREYWLDGISAHKEKQAKPKCGIVLRHYPNAPESLDALRATLPELQARYTVQFFFLEQEEDAPLIHALADIQPIVWQPESMSIDAFASKLAQQDVIITSRAHGVICAACLGVPSVIIAIEPKLETVHQMLPNSSVMVEHHGYHQWADAIEKALQVLPEAIDKDVNANANASKAAWQAIAALLS